jgi:GTP cyclohydrolase I
VATSIAVREDRPDAAAALVARLLSAIGEDPEREGLQKTPDRVAKALAFLTSGASKNPLDVLNGAIFKEAYEGLLVVRDIEFYSLCEHHLLPFFGRAHIAYLPAGQVIGLSKLPRLLDVYARRLQVQERLTDQVARAVQQAIRPRGVAVRIEAAHFCMMMRGVEKKESMTMTSSFLGEFKRDMSLRQEFLGALGEGPTLEGPRTLREIRTAADASTPIPRSASSRVEAGSGLPAEGRRIGVLTDAPRPVARGKYPQRVGPRPSRLR